MKEIKNSLPKYWVIRSDGSQLFRDTVIKYLNSIVGAKYWVGYQNYYYGFDGGVGPGGTNNWTCITNFKNNPQLLTIKQFIEMTKEREIIGYKAPYDLFGGSYKKDTVYIRDTGDFHFMYKPKKCVEGSKWSLPKEIVETWEPVYKEEEVILMLGNPSKSIIISKHKVVVEGKEIVLPYLYALHSTMNAYGNNIGWPVSFREVKIGCSYFTLEEVTQVINKLEELNR